MIARLSLIAIGGTAAIALVTALTAPAASNANRFSISTAPGFKITLMKAGKEVDYVRRGTYAITVRDTKRVHNVAIWPARVGARPKILTSFAFVGTKTVTVTLRPGRYTVACQRHYMPQGMLDAFIVE